MKTLINNKKAYFEYSITDKYVAGIQLIGTEVKSIKESKASITEAYCHIVNGEIFIKGMHISEYKQIKYTNHEPLRSRKLLLNKKEITKLAKAIKEKGLTIIPLGVMLSDTGFIKVEIGLAKGKNTVNKKESIKEKDLKREFDRTIK
jgi:SsrA-binding protein